jgi:hypothetical protein
MLEHLRQAAPLVRHLASAEQLCRPVPGMEIFRSGELPGYSLKNLVLPTGGGTFIELLRPAAGDSAAGRFLSRRGQAPYLLIFETKECDRPVPDLNAQGARITRRAGLCGPGRLFKAASDRLRTSASEVLTETVLNQTFGPICCWCIWTARPTLTGTTAMGMRLLPAAPMMNRRGVKVTARW